MYILVLYKAHLKQGGCHFIENIVHKIHRYPENNRQSICQFYLISTDIIPIHI